jgi:hypothetical protein
MHRFLMVRVDQTEKAPRKRLRRILAGTRSSEVLYSSEAVEIVAQLSCYRNLA